MKKTLSLFAYLAAIGLSFTFIYYGHGFTSQRPPSGMIYEKETELDSMVYATVTSIDRVQQKENPSEQVTFFTAKTFGNGNDKEVQGKQIINTGSRNMQRVSVGDRVVLLSYSEGLLFQYFFRFDKIIILGAAFALLLIFMGGSKGFNTILALALTCLSIFFVFIPAISSGFDIYISTVIICTYIILMTFLIVYGLNKKSMIAALSCILGVVVSGVLTGMMDRWMKLTGYLNDDMYMLGTQLGFEINVKALIFSMITIGALGAIMDVSMSITSALDELRQNNQKINAGALMKSGINIGRDIMGTMSNTLILAYIGSSLVTVMLYSSANYPLLGLLSKEEIIYEFLQSLVGSLSLLLTIPFTTFIAATLLSKRVEPYKNKRR